eukprot:12901900-Prorocentrum_lima.AAC.1
MGSTSTRRLTAWSNWTCGRRSSEGPDLPPATSSTPPAEAHHAGLMPWLSGQPSPLKPGGGETLRGVNTEFQARGWGRIIQEGR